jgi:threonine dehydrogenase-like Zn-dependent dehydrogenase
LLGSPRGSAEIDVYGLIHRTGVALRGAHESLLLKVADRTAIIEQILDHIGSRRLVVEPLISQISAPAELNTAYQTLLHRKDEAIGILVDWSQG